MKRIFSFSLFVFIWAGPAQADLWGLIQETAGLSTPAAAPEEPLVVAALAEEAVESHVTSVEVVKEVLSPEYDCSETAVPATPGFTYSNQFDYHRKDPSPSGAFPRNDLTRYRGQESELYPLEHVFDAIFDVRDRPIESSTFTMIRWMLMGVASLDHFPGTPGDTWKYPKNSRLLPKVQQLYKRVCHENPSGSGGCHIFKHREIALKHKSGPKSGRYMTLEDVILQIKKAHGGRVPKVQAIEYTKQVMDAHFKTLSAKGRANQLITYGADLHYPNEIIYSSVFPEVAHIYGASVLVMTGAGDGRGIDINYFNGANGRSWSGGADAGEFGDPGYIDDDQLIGVELHQRADYIDRLRQYLSFGGYAHQQQEPIQYAMYKVKEGKQTYMVVLDGKRKSSGYASPCIKKVSNTSFKHCDWTARGGTLSGNMMPRGPGSEEAQVIAVIGLCESGRSCAKPSSLLKTFRKRKSGRSMDEDLRSSGVGVKSLEDEIRRYRAKKGGRTFKFQIYRP